MLEDLDIFLADFSQQAVLTIGSTLKSIKVIFDEDYTPMDLVGAEGRSLTATCKSSDVRGATHRSLLQIGSFTYKVESVRPTMDGLFTELILKEHTGALPSMLPNLTLQATFNNPKKLLLYAVI